MPGGAVDASGLIRAATTDIAHGAVQQGGSTITEQLVKNRIMNPKGSLQKKVTEAVLALGSTGACRSARS